MKESNIRSQRGHENDPLNQMPNQLKLMSDNQVLSQKIYFLDEINKQLGNELVGLQAKLGIHPSMQKRPREEFNNSNKFKQISFQGDFTYLKQLLDCYTMKIEKMEVMLEKVYTDYRDMEKKADYLINDNSTLREQLEQKCQLILDIYQSGQMIDNMGNSYLKLEHEDMNQRISLLTEENKELTAKFQDISGKYSEVNRLWVDLKEQDADTQKLYKVAAEKCKKLELEAGEAKHQSEQSQNQLMQTIKQKVFYEGEKSDIDGKLSRSENEVKILKTQISNLKRNLGDLEAKKSTELDGLRRDVEEFREKERENLQSISALEKEIDQLTDENNKLTSERDQLREGQDQITRMMDGYQSRIQTFEKKEENAAKLQKEQREKVQNALLEKDKAVLREQQIEKTLTSIQENLNELKDQYEKIIDGLKLKHKQTLNDREEEIQQIGEELQAASYEKDKALKELAFVQQENKRLTVSVRDEFGQNTNNRAQEKDRRIQELEDKLQMMDQYHNDSSHAANMEKVQIETSYKNQQSIINDLRARNDKYREENLKLTSENSSMSTKVSGGQKEKQMVLDEITKIKRLFETKLTYAQEQFALKMKDVQDQLKDSLKRERTSREKAIELLQTHDKVTEEII